MSLKWRLYYDDGSSFGSEDGPPHESPIWGAVAVIQPGRGEESVLMDNGDYYLYRTDLGYWHEVGVSGLIDHIAHYAHLISCVRAGRWIPDRAEFKAIIVRGRREMNC